ncbi:MULTISPECIES: histidine phosphatase family protein [Microbacterium]|uniref:histidine phosphatase family protein n=1 Tax=Microbacterium TaxID=33882 RepID=UPI0010CA20C5|nr:MULTISPECIES: histidine phosphatase family protein [Microbacterium]MDQ1204031.1 serine/threonine-protein phosphatase PGAM5 [Microbacterium sp. SORGH_AS_0862]MDR6198873.1 serine/threonine-protein phosphatase PGAM5 [Microbacterium sp. SORGH_AS_0428]QCQ15588.1 histidine phosphatase family protein [Microbacterium sp. RG1]UIN29674.1 histidine phosphatase family protein [Microbacterium binotii]WDG19154.1 histidine phosphatase family protein [Microbacterium sp. Clip185]
MTHYIYLVRHGEHQDAEHGIDDGPLSPRGRRQAELLADRLSGVPFDAVWHSPLVRAAETARAVAERMPSITPEASSLLFDCVPTGMTEETPAVFEPFFGGITEAAVDAGRAQMADALAAFLVRKQGDVHELIITHNAVIGWFVREVLGAPDWRWMTLNQANAGLTVIAQRHGRPWTLVSHNDLAHLPFELRTGLPEVPPV